MATLYYNNATADDDWNTPGNWWTNPEFTIPATVLPSSSDDVIITATLTVNSGSTPTVANLTINGLNVFTTFVLSTITVTGLASANNAVVGNITAETVICNNCYLNNITATTIICNGFCYAYSVLNGNVITNDYTTFDPTIINGNLTANDFSNIYGDPVSGDATVNHNATTSGGTVMGNAIFNNSSYNGATVQGNATFKDSSYNTSQGTVGGSEIYSNRTPYPIPRGINGSNILGVI